MARIPDAERAANALHAGRVNTTATSQGAAPDLAPRLQAARTELAPALQGVGNVENTSVVATSRVATVEDVENASLRSTALDARSVTRSRLAPAPSSNSSSLAAAASGS